MIPRTPRVTRTDPLLPYTTLVRSRLGDAKVVEAEIGRQPRLLVTVEQRAGTGDVGPFGEALAPPGAVLRHRMVLRQVEGHEARAIFENHPVAARGMPWSSTATTVSSRLAREVASSGREYAPVGGTRRLADGRARRKE